MRFSLFKNFTKNIFVMPQFEFSKYSFRLNENDDVTQTHLLINLDRVGHSFDLSFEYRCEKLRREFEEKYLVNKDALFEWYPDELFGKIFGYDLSTYHWHYGDPGIWLAGRYLSHYGVVPVEERAGLHLAFRSTKEIEVIFYSVIDCLFFTTQTKKNYRRIKLAENRLKGLLSRFESHLPLV
ncbi:MAG TPA: hypothetical protein DGG95_07295 [Cytophagales bacterium]|jgi:hypothetical protein|nr:hypothetical protein [Cytophagales bacterium]